MISSHGNTLRDSNDLENGLVVTTLHFGLGECGQQQAEKRPKNFREKLHLRTGQATPFVKVLNDTHHIQLFIWGK